MWISLGECILFHFFIIAKTQQRTLFPAGFSEEEFFMGYSVPHNKELMRIFRDLDMVEQMGSGLPRILQQYQPSVYHFTANFIRVVFPFAAGFDGTMQVTDPASTQQVPRKHHAGTMQAKQILQYCSEPKSRAEI